MHRLRAPSFTLVLLLQACVGGGSSANGPLAPKAAETKPVAMTTAHKPVSSAATSPAKPTPQPPAPTKPAAKVTPAALTEAAKGSLDPGLLTCRGEAEAHCKAVIHNPKALADCLYQNKTKLVPLCKAALEAYRAKHK
jgi:hypothetical protein